MSQSEPSLPIYGRIHIQSHLKIKGYAQKDLSRQLLYHEVSVVMAFLQREQE